MLCSGGRGNKLVCSAERVDEFVRSEAVLERSDVSGSRGGSIFVGGGFDGAALSNVEGSSVLRMWEICVARSVLDWLMEAGVLLVMMFCWVVLIINGEGFVDVSTCTSCRNDGSSSFSWSDGAGVKVDGCFRAGPFT